MSFRIAPQICGYELRRGKKELHAAAERGHRDVAQKFLDVNAVDQVQGDT